MPTPNYVLALLGPRLIATDSLTPILLELAGENPSFKFSFLVSDGRWVAPLKDNLVLYTALSALGKIRILSEGTGSFPAKLRAGLRLVQHALMLLTRRSLLIGYADFAPFPYNILAACARLRGGRVVMHIKPPYPFAPTLRSEYENRVKDKDVAMRDAGDLFLLFHPDQHADYKPFTSKPGVVIGTPRVFPRWLAYLDQFRRRHGIIDYAGQPIDIDGRLVLTMSYVGPIQAALTYRMTDARTLALEFLRAVREVAPQALMILKPHPLCDVAQLQRDLEDFSDLDIRISFLHPQMLARISTAGVFPHPSTMINDFYVENRPAIDICDYPPEALDGGLFPNPGYLSAPTPQAMRDILRRVVTAPDTLIRPDNSHLCHPKVPSLLAIIAPDAG